MWTLSKSSKFQVWFDFYTLQNARERTCRLRNEVSGWFLLNLITGCPLSSLWRPRTIDFPPRFNLNQTLDPHGRISGFGTEKSCFSQVDPLWMSSEHSWGPEITRIAPGKCQKPSGIMGVDGIHIIPKSQIRFFYVKKKPDLFTSFTSPLSTHLLLITTITVKNPPPLIRNPGLIRGGGGFLILGVF